MKGIAHWTALTIKKRKPFIYILSKKIDDGNKIKKFMYYQEVSILLKKFSMYPAVPLTMLSNLVTLTKLLRFSPRSLTRPSFFPHLKAMGRCRNANQEPAIFSTIPCEITFEFVIELSETEKKL